MKLLRCLALASSMLSVAHAHAQATAAADHAGHHSPGPAGEVQSGLPKVDGVVEQLDVDQGLLVLRHGEIPNLGMAPMTMGFDVADRKLLDGLQVGQKVTFQADMVGGNATVIDLEPAR